MTVTFHPQLDAKCKNICMTMTQLKSQNKFKQFNQTNGENITSPPSPELDFPLNLFMAMAIAS